MKHATTLCWIMDYAVLVCICKMGSWACVHSQAAPKYYHKKKLAIVESIVSDSICFISPVTNLFPEYIIESKTDLLFEQLSNCSLVIIFFVESFLSNLEYVKSSFLHFVPKLQYLISFVHLGKNSSTKDLG